MLVSYLNSFIEDPSLGSPQSPGQLLLTFGERTSRTCLLVQCFWLLCPLGLLEQRREGATGLFCGAPTVHPELYTYAPQNLRLNQGGCSTFRG